MSETIDLLPIIRILLTITITRSTTRRAPLPMVTYMPFVLMTHLIKLTVAVSLTMSTGILRLPLAFFQMIKVSANAMVMVFARSQL